MKNVKAYVRTTLTAGLILAAAVLGGCSKSAAGSSAADTADASSGTESAASADASNSNKKELKYGKAAGPYTVLFEDAIKPILEKEGYTLTEVDFSDLLQNDLALNDGRIDFNVERIPLIPKISTKPRRVTWSRFPRFLPFRLPSFLPPKPLWTPFKTVPK